MNSKQQTLDLSVQNHFTGSLILNNTFTASPRDQQERKLGDWQDTNKIITKQSIKGTAKLLCSVKNQIVTSYVCRNTSFFVKSLEKILSRYNQKYAHQSGKITERALNKLVEGLKDTLEKNAE